MRPQPILPEGFPELPKPLAYVWPEDVYEGVFDVCYSPAGPKSDGSYSMAIYTEQQMIAYAAKVAIMFQNRIAAALV